jgi:predicted amidohydrolase YtcJ
LLQGWLPSRNARPAEAPGTWIAVVGGWHVTGFAGITSLYSRLPAPTPEQQRDGTRQWFRELNRHGVTCVHDAAGAGQTWSEAYAPVERLHAGGEMTVRVRWWMQPHVAGQELETVQRFTAEVPRAEGDDWLRPLGIGELPLQGIMDGDGVATPPREFTAEAMTDCASSCASSRKVVGGCTCTPLEIPHWSSFSQRVRSSFRAMTAPSGDGISTTARRRATRTCGASRQSAVASRCRTERCSGIRRCSLRAKTAVRCPPLRTALELGLPLGGGTDATRAASYDPFTSRWWMVTGRTVSGAPQRAREQRLTPLEALRAYTAGSAWFAFDEHRLGAIEAGKLADLVVLSDDLTALSDDRIRAVRPVLTIVGGRPVYLDDNLAGIDEAMQLARPEAG